MGGKPVYVLGSGLSHDGSACLIKDGRIRFAIEKERVTRRKHDGGNDTAAIQYLLDAEGIKLSDLSLIVQNANFGMFVHGSDWYEGQRLIGKDMPVVTISHHLAHAYGAFGTAPFDDAAVMIIDGCGNSFDDCMDLDGATLLARPEGETAHLWYEKDSYYGTGGGRLKPLIKDFSPWGSGHKKYPMHPTTTRHSIGGFYGAAAKYVFQGLDDPGKLMGLAPFGRPGVHDFEAFELKDGRVFLRQDWMGRFQNPARTYADFKAGFQEYADLAYWVQREVERAVLYVLRARHAESPTRNLCYAGGVALNAVANRRIVTEGPFENVFIQPAAGDNGLAIGCAYYGWLQVLGRERLRHDGSVFFGKSYPDDKIVETFRLYRELVSYSRSPDIAADTAAQLAAGKVVGWFQGGSEFGPRALGNRSILADPRVAGIRDFINGKVKFREDFRPFAPSVLAEDCSVFFDCDTASPYMLLTAPVRPEWQDKIPGVVHQDKSARIQTVIEDANPLYYRLLAAFKKRTGIGVILNTSLNRRGQPIAETPDDALALFLYSDMHVLVIGDYVVQKLPNFDARLNALKNLIAQNKAKEMVDKMIAS